MKKRLVLLLMAVLITLSVMTTIAFAGPEDDDPPTMPPIGTTLK
jgi:hypothetical protein